MQMGETEAAGQQGCNSKTGSQMLVKTLLDGFCLQGGHCCLAIIGCAHVLMVPRVICMSYQPKFSGLA